LSHRRSAAKALRLRARGGVGNSLGWLGALAGLTIAVACNLLSIRFDHRWDLTSNQRYTPSQMVRRILSGLADDATVVVLLARSDPVAPTIDLLLTSYRQLTPHLRVDWVDPDRDPLRFLARQSELGLTAGHTEEGQVTSDAVLVVTARGRRHYVEAQALVELDPDAGESTSRFEHAIAVALNSVLDQAPPTVCFTEGHRELSLTDQSPIGLARLKERLERETMVVKSVDLAGANNDSLGQCRLVIIAAPDVAISENAQQRLKQAATHSSILLLGGVVPDPAGNLASVGLESLASLGGIALGTAVVVEKDDAYLLPGVFGETFYATPLSHPTTRGLMRGQGASPLRVVVSLAQGMRKRPGSFALPLLESSAHSILLTEVSSAHVGADSTGHDDVGRHVVAMAAPLSGTNPLLRIAVLPANVLQNRSFDAPSLLVTQAFATSVVTWLVASPSSDLEYAPRPQRDAGAELSAEELGEVARYVGLVMPGCFLLAGISVLLLRRKQPRPTKEDSHLSHGPSQNPKQGKD